MINIFFLLLLLTVAGCDTVEEDSFSFPVSSLAKKSYHTIGEIPVPEGFIRVTAQKGSFAAWLRAVPLRADKTIRLYNGLPKSNQTCQFAVINLSIGNKDLLQCADAVIRLRAEYLYAQKKYAEIAFMDYNDKWYKWPGVANRPLFDKYLENVFGKCGSASMEKQLKTADNFSDIGSGDVFVQGGFPGHAMLVMDMAVNNRGTKIFMLAQGYMPAQDMHVVNNPVSTTLSPWYEVNDLDTIITPGWRFTKKHLKKWE
jgi:hypothetical protein